MKKLIFLALLSLAACSSGGGGDGGNTGEDNKDLGDGVPGSELSALTDQEKNRVTSLLGEIDDIKTIVGSKEITGVEIPQQSPIAEAQFSENGVKFKKSLKDAFDFSQCHGSIYFDPQSGDFDPDLPIYDYKIDHANSDKDCPIYYVESLKTKEVLGENSIERSTINDAHFKVDPLLHVRYDLDVHQFKTFLTQTQKNQRIDDDSTETVHSLDAKSEIHSQSEGIINSTMNMEGKISYKLDPATNNSSIVMSNDFTIKMSFADGFTVIGFQTAQMDSLEGKPLEIKYYINGVKTNKDEFEKFFYIEELSVTDFLIE